MAKDLFLGHFFVHLNGGFMKVHLFKGIFQAPQSILVNMVKFTFS